MSEMDRGIDLVVCSGAYERTPMLILMRLRRGASLTATSILADTAPQLDETGSARRARCPSFSRRSSVTMRQLRRPSAGHLDASLTPTVNVSERLVGAGWTAQARPEGIEITTSRFAGAVHIPSAVRSRLAVLQEANGGHVSRLTPCCGP